eukprot:5624852-Alexandrium_andersonii.AAC.1
MRTSGALADLLRTGTLSLVDEQEEMARRATAEGKSLKRRSQRASVETLRQEYQSRGRLSMQTPRSALLPGQCLCRVPTTAGA